MLLYSGVTAAAASRPGHGGWRRTLLPAPLPAGNVSGIQTRRPGNAPGSLVWLVAVDAVPGHVWRGAGEAGQTLPHAHIMRVSLMICKHIEYRGI